MPSNIVGLFIGIGTYFTSDGNVDEEKTLFSPPNDANLLSRAFLKHPITHKAITLTDNSDIRPTRNNIFSFLKAALEAATAESHFVLFFAGHGFTYGRDFILHPSDFDARIPHISGIKLNDIIEQLNIIKKNKLIICDCCRVNLENIDSDLIESFSGLPPLLIDEKTYIITSCTTGECSYESLAFNQTGAGIFSHFLSKNLLMNITKNNNRPISLYNIFNKTKIKTSKYLALNHEVMQTPMIHGGDANDWILFGNETLL